jgi:type I restriction enzyme S subunit
LRMGNLQGGQLDWGKLVYTSDKAEIEKYLLEPGDVLFNRTNSPELVGKTSIYRGERKAIYAGYLIRFKGSERLNPEYINIQMNSPHARDYCWQVKTDGVSQSNINAKKLQAYEFELPEMEEQSEIVRRVSELLSRADVFEKQYHDARSHLNRLTQSILAKAFRGELVSQNPNDEPASVLLEKIKRKKEQPAKNKNVPKKPKKNTVAVKAKPKPSETSKVDDSRVLSIIQSAKGALSLQQIIDKLDGEFFETVDLLFAELKRLLDGASIQKLGEGEAVKFRVINR